MELFPPPHFNAFVFKFDLTSSELDLMAWKAKKRSENDFGKTKKDWVSEWIRFSLHKKAVIQVGKKKEFKRFLVAFSDLHKRVCSSVRPSVPPSKIRGMKFLNKFLFYKREWKVILISRTPDVSDVSSLLDLFSPGRGRELGLFGMEQGPRGSIRC